MREGGMKVLMEGGWMEGGRGGWRYEGGWERRRGERIDGGRDEGGWMEG